MKQLSGLVCAVGVLALSLASAMEPQVNVPLITQMNRLPAPLNIPNWKQDALDYSQFIFDRTVTGSNMPSSMWWVTPFSPPSGPLMSFLNGLHPKSNFLEFILSTDHKPGA